MDNRTLVDILMKIIIKYGKISVCTFDCPVRHVLTGDGKAISPELFFQTGKWNCVDVFSVEYGRLKRWGYKTSSQQTGWMWGFFHRISLFAGINSNMMFLYFYFCRDKTVPFVYLIRQLFPARLSKEILQFFLCQIVFYFYHRYPGKVFFSFSFFLYWTFFLQWFLFPFHPEQQEPLLH